MSKATFDQLLTYARRVTDINNSAMVINLEAAVETGALETASEALEFVKNMVEAFRA